MPAKPTHRTIKKAALLRKYIFFSGYETVNVMKIVCLK
jgi:hypothetical protein